MHYALIYHGIAPIQVKSTRVLKQRDVNITGIYAHARGVYMHSKIEGSSMTCPLKCTKNTHPRAHNPPRMHCVKQLKTICLFIQTSNHKLVLKYSFKPIQSSITIDCFEFANHLRNKPNTLS